MADLFKGYVPSNGKMPIMEYVNADLLPEPPTSGDYCGVLHEDIVQLDFDDSESASIVMRIVQDNKLKCDMLQTTRGVHLYFKDDGYCKSTKVGIFNAIGLRCDIGLGKKNRAVPLRITSTIDQIEIVDGEEQIKTVKQVIQRPWLQVYSELEDLPAIFRPIDKVDREMRKSDTRNQTLFTYILTLQTHEFLKEEIIDVIKTINKYVLYSPLSDKEIDTITRDDAFSEDIFFDKDKFLHDRFGNYMLGNSNVVLINEQPHIYTRDQIYSNDPLEFERRMVEKIPQLKDAQRKEVYKYMALKCNTRAEFSNAKYLGLKSKILDVETMRLLDYSPYLLINNRIGYDYKPNAYSEIMDKTLDKVCKNDKQIRALFEEMVGYSLYRANTMQVCFILTGEGANGKSTMLNAIKKLLGKKNYTSLDMRELEEPFKPAELYGKLANIGDDISPKYMDNSSTFKKCVTGESFITSRKYGQPFELEAYATQIFCANELPPVKDRSNGFNRRIIIMPFNAKFTKSDPDYDPFINDKLLTDEALEYLLKIAVEGLKRVLINNEFTTSRASEIEKEAYVRANNNVLEWLDDYPKVENESVNDVYLMYKMWCAENGGVPVKKGNMSKEIKKELGLSSVPKYIDGKTIRVYERVDEDES